MFGVSVAESTSLMTIGASSYFGAFLHNVLFYLAIGLGILVLTSFILTRIFKLIISFIFLFLSKE